MQKLYGKKISVIWKKKKKKKRNSGLDWVLARVMFKKMNQAEFGGFHNEIFQSAKLISEVHSGDWLKIYCLMHEI